jgi:hypothetical protein
MSKYPLKIMSAKKPAAPKAAHEVVEAAPEQHVGFISFRYSSTELWSHGGRTRVKAKQVSLQDGKLGTETFEGELGGQAYGELVRQAQQQVLRQTAWLLRSLAWWLRRFGAANPIESERPQGRASPSPPPRGFKQSGRATFA